MFLLVSLLGAFSLGFGAIIAGISGSEIAGWIGGPALAALLVFSEA